MENNDTKSITDSPSIGKVDVVNKQVRKSRWTTIRRWLRYATLAVLGVIFCVTLVFWIRSYWQIDHLHGILWGEHRLFVRSGGGEIVFTEYKLVAQSTFPLEYPSWEIRSYVRGEVVHGTDDFGALVAEKISSLSDSERPLRVLWADPSPKLEQQIASFLPSIPDMSAHGVAFPHLLLLLMVGSLFFLVLRKWQFSLRAFFIWVTIVCIAMACAVVFISVAKEISVHPLNPIIIL